MVLVNIAASLETMCVPPPPPPPPPAPLLRRRSCDKIIDRIVRAVVPVGSAQPEQGLCGRLPDIQCGQVYRERQRVLCRPFPADIRARNMRRASYGSVLD
jgi:hypothetical protein